MARLTRDGLSLPWNREPGEQSRLALIFMIMLVLFLPPALIIPALDLPDPEPAPLEPVPTQAARMLDEPEPERDEPDAAPEPEPADEPEPEVAEAEPEPEPVEAPPPAPQPETVEEAREVAQQSGLLAMQDDLAALRDMAEPQGSEVTRDAPAESGTTGDLLAGPDSTAVTRGSGGSGVEGGGDVEEVAMTRRQARQLEREAEDTRAPEASGSSAQRPMATIRETFDRNKSALFSIYNRALRSNPMLAGKIVLELVISPEGQVMEARILESELGDEEVEQRILSRIRLFNFGAMDVPERTVEFPVDFLPP